MRKITILGVCLFLSIALFAQTNSKIQKFQSEYSETYAKNSETVFLHLNKTAVLPQEKIWFSAYVVDLQTNTPLNDATNLKISVFDKDGNFVEEELVFVWNGKASGYIDLTKDIYSSGRYFLKAQTPYMDDQLQDLSYLGSFSIIDEPYTATRVTPEYEVHVLAEGGDLLANIENNMGIKLETNLPGDKNFEGILLNSTNDTLKKFSSNERGLAEMAFTPDLKEDYFVQLNLSNGQVLKEKVPQILEKGLSLAVNVRTNEVFISVKTNEKSFSEIRDKIFHLAISKNADIKNYTFKIPENSKEALFEFKNDSIFKGVNRITIFDDKFDPVAERLIFNNYDLPETKVKASLVENTGDSIKYSIEGNNEDIYRLSITALPEGTKAYKPANNILSAIMLRPYIKGEIENPQYFFDENIDARKRMYDLNLLLLSQGWSKFNWNEILNTEDSRRERVKGFKLFGRVTGKSDNDRQIFIRDDRTGLMNVADLKGNGTFEFNNLYLEDSTKLSVGLLNSRKGKVNKPVINYKVLPEVSDTTRNITDLYNGPNYGKNYTTPVEDFIDPSETLATVNIYGRNISKDDEVEKEMLMFNTTSALSKFIKIDERQESMYHYVTQLIEQNGFRVRRTLGNIQIYSKTPVAFQGQVLTPQFYVDGVRIMDFNMLQTLRTDEIDYIYFNRSASAGYGQGAGNGVIKVKLRQGGPRGDSRETIQEILVTNGYQQQKEYYSPKYRSYTSDIFQDFGSIGWNADVIITPENLGEFVVRNTYQNNVRLYVEGITQSGKLISEEILVPGK